MRRLFKTGDTVIHPSWVVCKVKDVRNSLSDNKNDFLYVLKPYSVKDLGGFKILVTAEQVKQSGIRYPIKEKNIAEIFDILKEKPNPPLLDGNDTYSLMEEKILSGDLFKCAEVLRDMKLHDDDFQWLHTHKELLESARRRLVEEISYVKKKPRTQINRLIDSALSKNTKID